MFRIWSDPDFARRIVELEQGKRVGKAEAKPEAAAAVSPAAPKTAARSEAVSLLAVLQREGRFVDFIKEPVASYSDAQIGAAVRDVHKGCAGALERIFALEPVNAVAEGSPVEVQPGFDPARTRVTGNVRGEPPFRGTLQHHGWTATRCDLPEWTGSDASALVIAPAEVEIK